METAGSSDPPPFASENDASRPATSAPSMRHAETSGSAESIDRTHFVPELQRGYPLGEDGELLPISVQYSLWSKTVWTMALVFFAAIWIGYLIISAGGNGNRQIDGVLAISAFCVPMIAICGYRVWRLLTTGPGLVVSKAGIEGKRVGEKLIPWHAVGRLEYRKNASREVLTIEHSDGSKTEIISWSDFSPDLYALYQLFGNRIETGCFRFHPSSAKETALIVLLVIVALAVFFGGGFFAISRGMSAGFYLLLVLGLVALAAIAQRIYTRLTSQSGPQSRG